MASLHDISLRQLEYFVAVADLLGFRRAAKHCHVSQPALSVQIQQLETALGVKIFERDKRGVSLTGAGADLVERARRVLAEASEILSAAERMENPFTGRVHLGVIPTVAPYVLPELLLAMRGHYPQLQMQLTEDRPRALMKALAEGRLDTALLSLETSLGEMEVEYVGLAVDPFVVALPLDHPLASKQQLQPEDLDSEQVLLLEDEDGLSRQVPSLFTRRRASTVDCRATSLTTLVQMVVRGIGITLLPSLAVSLVNHNGHLAVRPLVAPALNRTLALVWRPGHSRSHALREIGHTLRTAWPGSQATAEASSVGRTTQQAALSPSLSAAPPDGRYLL